MPKSLAVPVGSYHPVKVQVDGAALRHRDAIAVKPTLLTIKIGRDPEFLGALSSGSTLTMAGDLDSAIFSLSVSIGVQPRPHGITVYIIDYDREIPLQSGFALAPMKRHLSDIFRHEINKLAIFRCWPSLDADLQHWPCASAAGLEHYPKLFIVSADGTLAPILDFRNTCGLK